MKDISPQPHILEHIQKFPNKIEDIKQLQRFLGILTYSENYIPGLAKMRAPLQSKLKKENPWNWTQENSDYVAKIKKKLSVFPKLYHPNIEDELIIETDASDHFWGGILKAKTTKNIEQICRYTSGSFKEQDDRSWKEEEEEVISHSDFIKLFIKVRNSSFESYDEEKFISYQLKKELFFI